MNASDRKVYRYLKRRYEERSKLLHVYEYAMRKINIGACAKTEKSIIVDNLVIQYKPLGKGYDGSTYLEADKIQMFYELKNIFKEAFYDEMYTVDICMDKFIKGCFFIRVEFKINDGEKKDDVLL
jgi:hypothetical protein